MQLYIHRVNTISELRTTPTHYGVEIDIRGEDGDLLLSHDPIVPGETHDRLEDYLAAFAHHGIIFNLKEAGYEDRVLALATRYKIKNHFLLDVEFPYLYRATRRQGVRTLAIRYSEAEPIEMVEAQMRDGEPLLDWVWIDTNTTLPLTADTVMRLAPFKTCLVCPERWGRPEDIPRYATAMQALNFTPTAVMTALPHAQTWENLYTNDTP
jgi:hypothetical protein